MAYVSFTHPSFQSINLRPLFFKKNLKEKKKEKRGTKDPKSTKGKTGRKGKREKGKGSVGMFADDQSP